MEVDALLEQLETPPSVRVRIAQTAGGNPLFAEELVAWVREGGALEELPAGLNALLGARLDQLDPDARDALERGAVEGELFHQAAIVELSDEPVRSAVPGELGQLARKDLIRLAAAGLLAGGVAYRFKHILVREAAYLATAKRLRALLHERYADWLEQVVGERVGEYHEILGYHLEQAYRYRSELGTLDESAARLASRAAAHLEAAGLRAGNRGDPNAAVKLLERALGLGIPDARSRVRV
jgi:predicted ATPase